MVVFLTQVVSYEQQALEEFRLKKTVNYAVDCAIEEMLRSDDLGMDYTDWSNFVANPNKAVEGFTSCFCMNYDMIPTKENRDIIAHAYTKVFAVCAFDGYYIYTPQQIDDTGKMEYISTPKLPYKYERNGTVYALNLGMEYCWSFDDSNRLKRVNVPVNKTQLLKEVNKVVSDEIYYQLDKQYAHGYGRQVYIPSNITAIKSSNPINRPTVLAFVDDVDILSSKQVSAFGVGGAHVTNSRSVAVYTRDGVKYHCSTDLLPEDLFSNMKGVPGKIFIENTYQSVNEAAEHGYHHDDLYMK